MSSHIWLLPKIPFTVVKPVELIPYAFVRASTGVATVVSLLLKRDPSERISAYKAVTMLALVLWAPASWLQGKCVSVVDVDR